MFTRRHITPAKPPLIVSTMDAHQNRGFTKGRLPMSADDFAN